MKKIDFCIEKKKALWNLKENKMLKNNHKL